MLAWHPQPSGQPYIWSTPSPGEASAASYAANTSGSESMASSVVSPFASAKALLVISPCTPALAISLPKRVTWSLTEEPSGIVPARNWSWFGSHELTQKSNSPVAIDT